jgi:UDP-N-acetylmuramyl pentapeptide synthase
VSEKSVILVKGSRGMKMEEIVAGLGGLANDD